MGKENPEQDSAKTTLIQLKSDELENLPDDLEYTRVSTSVAYSEQSSYSGPIPPASEMKAYEEAVPGLADRIMKVYEHQQQHSLGMEEKMVGAARFTFILEHIWSWIFVTALACAGFYFVVTGKIAFGSGVGGLAVLPVLIQQVRRIWRGAIKVTQSRDNENAPQPEKRKSDS